MTDAISSPGTLSELARLKSAYEALQREHDTARAALRAAVSILADHDALRERTRATLFGLLDVLGMKPTREQSDIHERDTLPPPAFASLDVDDDDGPTDLVIAEVATCPR